MPRKERVVVFAIGAVGYPILETLYRGRTHWSMSLAGGACFSAIYAVHKSGRPLLSRCARAAACVTGIEFAVGLVVNRWLRLGVWDYSKNRWNVMGQVCPRFAAVWLGVSALASPVCHGLRLYFSRPIAYNQKQS